MGCQMNLTPVSAMIGKTPLVLVPQVVHLEAFRIGEVDRYL